MTRKMGIIAAFGLMFVALFLQEHGNVAVGALARGEAAPAFTAIDSEGALIRSVDLPAGARIYNFWAEWCAPCRSEIPELNALYEQREQTGARVYGIAVDSGNAEEVRQAARELGIQYPVWVGDRALAEAFEVHLLPTTVVVDKSGVVIAHISGKVTRAGIAALIQGPVSTAHMTH